MESSIDASRQNIAFDISEAKIKLAAIVAKYKSYEDLTPSQPPKIGSYWSPSYGFLRISENTTGYQYGFSVPIKIGVEIGSKFANYNYDVINSLKAEVIEVINQLIAKHGGRIYNQFGSAYSQVGWEHRV